MEFNMRYRGRVVENPSAVINRMAEKLSPRNLQRLAQTGEQEMRKYMTAVADDLIRRHSGPWPTGTTATTLSKRSGKGVRSIRNFMVRRRATEVEGIWRLTRYMSFHEKGGIIRARSARYLTVPLPAALNADGTPIHIRARDWPDTFVIMSRRNNLLIVQRRGRQIVPLYVLKKSVRIPPRLGMEKTIRQFGPTFRKNVQSRIRELLTLQQRNNRK